MQMHIIAFSSCTKIRWEDAGKIGDANFNRTGQFTTKENKKLGWMITMKLVKDQGSLLWWHMSITLAPRRLREEELEFRANLVCTRLSEK